MMPSFDKLQNKCLLREIQRIICFMAMLGIALSVPNYWENGDFKSKESTEEGQNAGPKEVSCPCGWTNKGRIVGGRETLPNEFPLMAGLVATKDELLFCGASIITVHHALTAVHCTAPFKGTQIHLIVGEHDFLADKDNKKVAVFYPIDQIFEHEEYNDMTLTNDIALVTIKTKIEFSQKIGPVCLPGGMMDLVNEHVKVLGWGYTTDGGEQSSVLMKVNLKVIETKECYESHPIDIGSPNAQNVICTYRDNKDSCEGDSGGPVLWLDPETNRFTLVGLVSHGRMCAGDSPAINANIGHFLPWIREKIALSGFQEKTCSKINKKNFYF